MGLLASKIATTLALPLGAGLGLGWLAAVLLLAGRRRAGGACLVAALLILWGASTPLVSNRVRSRLERAHPAVPIEELGHADAIVVMGGGLGPAVPPRQTVDLGGAADRVLHAARLYRAHVAPRVLVTGGAMPWHGDVPPGAASMASLLREWGVPDEAIVVEARGRTTREDCVFAQERLRELGLGDVVLVTSALHMSRALATCRTAGMRARPATTDFEVVALGVGWLSFFPDARALEGTNRAAKEWLGWHVYRLRGWID